MCCVCSPWVSLYVTPVMLKSAALSRDLWYTHWMCSGSSPSRTTLSNTHTQTQTNKNLSLLVCKGLESQGTGLLGLLMSLLSVIHTSKGFLFGPQQHPDILHAVFWQTRHGGYRTHGEVDLQRKVYFSNNKLTRNCFSIRPQIVVVNIIL